MTFRARLGLFFVAALVTVQVLTAILVYEVTRSQLIDQGKQQLTVSAGAFLRQLDDISVRVADSVQVLARDFALRTAIAQSDRDTVLSALRNHGNRVGAARMMLVGLDGTIEADTQPRPGTGKFPFADLLDASLAHGTSAVVPMDEAAFWMVVVPVLAPGPIGFIAAAIPMDERFLARLQQDFALRTAIQLVTPGGAVLARSDPDVTLGALPPAPALVMVKGKEYVAYATRLHESQGNAPVFAILAFSLNDALRPYRAVASAWAMLLTIGLSVGLVGAWLIARGISRPVELLAATARRIEGGDYNPPPVPRQAGEIGQLSAAFVKMAHAIGEREERIRFQADHDSVTGLPNRQAAEARIGREGALAIVGLTRFPEIVKTMGHRICDRLMKDAGVRIRRLAGQALVARVSDTAFAVWLPEAGKADAIGLAFRIVEMLRDPYQEADLAIDMVPAAGIALAPEHGREAATLLQRAEVALYAAAGSEDPVTVYDPVTDPHRPERLSLMGDLREAIERDHLELFYQPKLHLASGTVDGAEGLVRWNHRKRGDIPPDSFIGLAEETGNIRLLSRWVLAAGIAQAQRWRTMGWRGRLSVNLSVRDLADTDLPRRIRHLLSIHEVPAESLGLEITESAVMGEPLAAIQVLRNLADLGIDLAIDDFGVGQSSFAYLRRLPVRELKIDRSFIRRLGEDEEDRTIVASIVELGHRLGYHVTAEGVEDEGALDHLSRLGCDHAQGYHIGKPTRPESFLSFLRPAALLSIAAALLLPLLTAARPALAQDISLHGFIDARLVAPPSQTSWTRGGLGKTRYGGGDLQGRFGAAALEGSVQILPDLRLFADVQARTTDNLSVSLIEAYARYRPVSLTPWRWSLKGGMFFPPVSLENDGIGWTSDWTLTPSAIDSWVGEELRTIGGEARIEWRGAVDRIEAAGALFAANDPAGAVLAARGWSFSDLTYGLGDEVREPDVFARAVGALPPRRVDEFQEIDGNPGWYGTVSWRSAEYGRLTLLRYDNEGDPTRRRELRDETYVYAWATNFWSVGASTDFGDWVLMAQLMSGRTAVAPRVRVTTDFQAGYALLGWDLGAWRPAARIDLFATSREHGNAVTLALNWLPRAWLRVTGELLRVDSWRLQRLAAGLPAGEVDTQFQLGMRASF